MLAFNMPWAIVPVGGVLRRGTNLLSCGRWDADMRETVLISHEFQEDSKDLRVDRDDRD